MYRLGLDVGTNSIGWCVLDLNDRGEPVGVRDLGVRIFHNGRAPQKGTSLAVDRRIARGARRRRDRFLLRRGDLMTALVHHGLMPVDEAERKKLEALDPYAIRARALDEAAPLHHLGRALFHLHQRRGFRSNRKADAGKDEDAGKIRQAGERLAEALEQTDCRTLGEFLARRQVGLPSNHPDREPVRARLRGQGAKAEYEFYPQRWMVEAEFDALWAAQQPHHPETLIDAAREDLRAVMFRQRPLRPVDPGKCALDPARDRDDAGGFRAPRALPLAQCFRIYQELANLRFHRLGEPERALDRAQRDALAKLMFQGKDLTFKRIRRILGFDEDVLFNLESARRKGLKGDETANRLAAKGAFGPAWHDLPFDRQNAIVEYLLEEAQESPLVDWLRRECGLDEKAAVKVARTGLSDGHARLGRRALGRLVAVMAEETEEVVEEDGEVRAVVLTYDRACARAGYHHSHTDKEELLSCLPYYGKALEDHVSGTGDADDRPEVRYGRIPNPTVHIGLNQLRRLVNALIEVHGRPDQIVVELARELKQTQEEKKRVEREQTENQAKNDARRERLKDLGQPDNGENRLRLRLYEELDAIDRRCVYTGEQIGLAMLFSDAVQIDHILPFSKTLDDGFANKVLSLRRANKEKTNQTPHEAFGHRPEWPDILHRAEALPANKRWRFGPDAMERFRRDHDDFIARQLTDTAYLARVAKEYLGHVCDRDRVWVVTGRLTAQLRGRWGLNSLLWDHNFKNRVDHRHHAIDAFVAAVTSRGMLNAIARAAGRAEDDQLDRLLDDMPEPFPGFRDQIRGHLDGMVVSVKPDHGDRHPPERPTAGRLHEDTAYGIVADPEREDSYNLVHRKPLPSLTVGEIARIRELGLRARVQKHVEESRAAGQSLKEALATFSERENVRRVRLLKREDSTIKVCDRTGRAFKALVPGENLRVDIYEQPNGKWVVEGITVFDASQPEPPRRKRAHPAARKIMSLYKGDVVVLDVDGRDRVMRVVQLEPSANRVRLAAVAESGELQKRHDDPDDPFRWDLANVSKLKGRGARKVRIDELGRVFDPGPPA